VNWRPALVAAVVALAVPAAARRASPDPQAAADATAAAKWQKECLAEIGKALDEADRIRPGFRKNAEYSTIFDGPGKTVWPSFEMESKKDTRDEETFLDATILLSTQPCCKETGWLWNKTNRPLRFDREPLATGLLVFQADREAANGLVLSITSYHIEWPAARRLMRLFRDTLDRCAEAMPQSLAQRIVARGGSQITHPRKSFRFDSTPARKP
jgi:hypothetical protein